MNSEHNKRVHALLSQTGLMPQKGNIILGISNGRTESSRELDHHESLALIAYLKQQPKKKADPAEKMRRKIISYAHQMGWHLPGTQTINMERVNGWTMQYGYLHKELNSYSITELPKLLTQFETVYKQFLNKF